MYFSYSCRANSGSVGYMYLGKEFDSVEIVFTGCLPGLIGFLSILTQNTVFTHFVYVHIFLGAVAPLDPPYRVAVVVFIIVIDNPRAYPMWLMRGRMTSEMYLKAPFSGAPPCRRLY